MNAFEKGLVTILVCNAVFAAVSIPLILRKVPRNPLYGYRMRATLSDDLLWYNANAYFGLRFLVASLVSAGIAVGLHEWQGLSPEAYLRVSVLLLVVPVAVAGLLTARFVRVSAAGRRSENGSG